MDATARALDSDVTLVLEPSAISFQLPQIADHIQTECGGTGVLARGLPKLLQKHHQQPAVRAIPAAGGVLGFLDRFRGKVVSPALRSVPYPSNSASQKSSKKQFALEFDPGRSFVLKEPVLWPALGAVFPSRGAGGRLHRRNLWLRDANGLLWRGRSSGEGWLRGGFRSGRLFIV